MVRSHLRMLPPRYESCWRGAYFPFRTKSEIIGGDELGASQVERGDAEGYGIINALASNRGRVTWRTVVADYDVHE